MKNIRGGRARARGSIARSFQSRLAVACLATSLAGAPVSGALADEGFTGIQFEFSLGRSPELRQVNLAFQGDIGRSPAFELERGGLSGIAIPLYSTDARAPGLLNHLNAAESGAKEKSKDSAGTVVAVLLGLGLAALVVYKLGECMFEYDQTKEEQKDCDSLSQGVGGLGGLS